MDAIEDALQQSRAGWIAQAGLEGRKQKKRREKKKRIEILMNK